jgi:hypothetical protein
VSEELARDREVLARQHQADVRYLAWLRQLAAFLRHEVRQPVAQINSSIEIVQLNCDVDEKLKPYLASAALSTQHVWNLIERAPALRPMPRPLCASTTHGQWNFTVW